MKTNIVLKEINELPYLVARQNNGELLKSPMNYIGGKYKILNQILPLFPHNIDTFVDLFAGGCNVGLNIQANKTIYNDNLIYLIDLYKKLQTTPINETIDYIYEQIDNFNLSVENNDGYIEFRKKYNKEKYPLDLFILTAYSFNHQIRFNSVHEFNNPFGKNRSCYNPSIERNLINFISKIQSSNSFFTNSSFDEMDLTYLGDNDFLYCDPPYLITTGTYNDGKRGFKGWSEKEERSLLKLLNDLNKRKVKFALSNVLIHKGNTNHILESWLNDNSYHIHDINHNYSNSSYNTKNRCKDSSREVLITNYLTKNKEQFELF